MRRWCWYHVWLWSAAAAAASGTQQQASPLPPIEVETLAQASLRSAMPQFGDREPDEAEDDDSLLQWAARLSRQPSNPRSNTESILLPLTCSDCFLVVGVKTRVVHGFHSRQIIRNTWANPHNTQKLHTRVVFLACQPDPEQLQQDMNHTLDALAMEKQVYGDLLTHELGDCVDSYHSLVEKVVGFYHWVSVHYPRATYVMTADDDVYVRLDRVVDMLRDEATPRVRYYAGQVPYFETGSLAEAMRSPYSKYFLPPEKYPMSEHPPRAIGPHYLLSADLVRFLDRNRHQLRGIGTIEDLSVGYWLRALLQIHPVHIPVFDSILSNLCRPSLVSYGDLSLHGIRQIHANLEHDGSFCRGFSWGAWVNPSVKLPEYVAFKPRNDVEYKWDFQVDPVTRTFQTDIIVHLPFVPISLPSVTFTPSMESCDHLCVKLHRVAASLNQRLPIMLCDDLFSRLIDFTRRGPETNSAAFALTRSNLPPLSGFVVYVNVWISHRTLRWRTLVECLIAEIYPDIHIYVLDQITSPTATSLIKPDFAVVENEELRFPPEVSSKCRFLVFDTTADAHWMRGARWLDRVIRISRERHPTTNKASALWVPHLFVPLASMVFSDSYVHSPSELLQPSDKRRPNFYPDQLYAVSQCDTHVASLLQAAFPPVLSSLCSIFPSGDSHDEDMLSSKSIFAFDTEVTQYAQSKFVLAFENQQNTPGYIAQTIVAAFLAGSVPIYLGDHATVSQLFNPNAFISCGRFPSLHDCAEYVKQVDQMPELYEAMRSEAPVVNKTAFYEAFSWHPDVLELLRAEQGDAFAHVDMIERLRDMINSV